MKRSQNPSNLMHVSKSTSKITQNGMAMTMFYRIDISITNLKICQKSTLITSRTMIHFFSFPSLFATDAQSYIKQLLKKRSTAHQTTYLTFKISNLRILKKAWAFQCFVIYLEYIQKNLLPEIVNRYNELLNCCCQYPMNF